LGIHQASTSSGIRQEQGSSEMAAAWVVETTVQAASAVAAPAVAAVRAAKLAPWVELLAEPAEQEA
jgi:hypothetical protein